MSDATPLTSRPMSRRALIGAGLATGAAGLATAMLGRDGARAATQAASGTTGGATTATTRAAAAPSLETAVLRPAPRFGVNYVPSTVWWDIWQRFDAHRVEDDLAAVASLGVDHIRIQLLWDVFQPTPAGGDPAMLTNLQRLMDIAAHYRLDVCPSVVTSALSGTKFVPAWANGKDWITEPDLVTAQARYIRDVGKAIGAHPSLLGFDLGNENLGQAPDRNATHLAAWARRLIHESHLAAPGKTHTVSPNGVFAVPYPEIVASVGDLSVAHPWCFIGDSTTDGQIKHSAAHHAEFNVEHIRSYHAFGPGARRHVWVQEVGAPRVNFYGQQVVPASLSADFLEQTVTNVLTSEDVYGITWWCSHEINPAKQPGRFHTPEYTLGLFGLSGKPKPIATRYAEVIQRARTGQLPELQARHTAIVGSDSLLFDKLQTSGVNPAIVQPDRVGDTAYLARRGITTLIRS